MCACIGARVCVCVLFAEAITLSTDEGQIISIASLPRRFLSASLFFFFSSPFFLSCFASFFFLCTFAWRTTTGKANVYDKKSTRAIKKRKEKRKGGKNRYFDTDVPGVTGILNPLRRETEFNIPSYLACADSFCFWTSLGTWLSRHALDAASRQGGKEE